MNSDTLVLDVRDLRAVFDTIAGLVRVVNGISFWVREREVLGLVGESGSGKSVAVDAVMNLMKPPGKVTGGEVWFLGRDLLKQPQEELQKIRGKEIGFVGSNPRADLNPLQRVGDQIAGVYQVHTEVSKKEAAAKALESLVSVGINDPERRFSAYPHELSAGMAQRVSIAMALICSPRLIILDEPTSALDVTIQAQMLELINHLVKERGSATLIATRDLGIVAHYCDKVAVMYAGRIVEYSDMRTFFRNPRHPYSRALLGSVALDPAKRQVIGGTAPDPMDLPQGCHFHLRCLLAQGICREEYPEAFEIDSGHFVSCYFVKDSADATNR